MAMPTLLDIVRLHGSDAAAGLVEEASRATPEVSGANAARVIPGLNYYQRVRTGVPTVNFRSVNEGTAVSGSTWEKRLVECFLLNPQFEVDKAAADAAPDGAAAYLAEEALGITEGAMQALGAAFFYGTDATHGKAKAFPGLLQCYDSTNMVVDAAGTTATTGSSVWLVRWSPIDVRWVMGEGGRAEVTDPETVRVTDTNQNPYTAYRQELYMRPGLQVGSVYSVCRIKKITADSGKTLTDDLIYQALAKFPAGKPPTVMYMTRRSLYQLRESRTAVNATGAPAPIPTEVAGIPIQATESLSDVEALTL